MSAASGNGSDHRPSGEPPGPPDPARQGRGLVVVVVAVVIGVLLLPSAARAPLPVNANATIPTTTTPSTGTGTNSGHATTSSTSTTIAPASVHVLVANATTTNGVAGAVTTFLSSKGFGTLPATNALVKVTASEVFTVGGATADVQAVAAALNLPATSIEPAASSAPVSSSAGANVVVIVGPDLASRYGPGATTTSHPAG
ncbi:MAG TPA: LytR C-terminal domain-containing protein [Acidimicrobiales bacterium]|nr:LytR C-terminal domain-containing protein [Acidimicrobiales bacterium]